MLGVGISLKTQILYCIVFYTRYLDLFTFISFYNTVMKLFFLSTSTYTVYLMYVKFKATRDPALDTMRMEYLVGGSAVLSLIFHDAFTLTEVWPLL
jgi:ER lumen protein retaining receptor